MQLEDAVSERHGVVVAHAALMLYAQDARQAMFRAEVAMCILTPGRGDAETTIEFGDQLATQQRVGLGHRRDLGQTQLLDPAILQRAEQTLHASLGLRTVG